MPSHTPNPLLRRRGGQPGNTNAVKHGFYSRRFRKNEVEDLENTNFTGLSDEIAMLRVCIRRVMEWGKDIHSLPDALSFLRIISLASGSLSRLVNTQKAIAGSGLEEAITQAIYDVGVEMGIVDPATGNLTPTSPAPSAPSAPPPPVFSLEKHLHEDT